jgi:hypothetical protein
MACATTSPNNAVELTVFGPEMDLPRTFPVVMAEHGLKVF